MAEITIPFRSEDDLAIEVVDAARETLDGDELRVMEQLAYDAMSRGTTASPGCSLSWREPAPARLGVSITQSGLNPIPPELAGEATAVSRCR